MVTMVGHDTLPARRGGRARSVAVHAHPVLDHLERRNCNEVLNKWYVMVCIVGHDILQACRSKCARGVGVPAHRVLDHLDGNKELHCLAVPLPAETLTFPPLPVPLRGLRDPERTP